MRRWPAAILSVLCVAAVMTGPSAVADPVPTQTNALAAVADPSARSGSTATAAADQVTVDGTVRDDRGAPLAGVPVVASSAGAVPVTTGSDGAYELVVSRFEQSVCADGTHIGDAGYGYARRCIGLPTTGRRTARVDFTLQALAAATGRVVDAQGNGLHDVLLKDGNTDTGVVTDADGRYTLRAVEGTTAKVCGTGVGDHGGASPTGYLDDCGPDFHVAARQVTNAPDVVLGQVAGAIAGTVRDGMAGAGLAGVIVDAWGQNSGQTAHTTTAADGSYHLLGLEAAQWTVCFTARGATGGTGSTGYGD